MTVRFRTTVALTSLLFALAAVFGGLGYWQLQRMHEKERLFEQFESAPEMALGDAVRERALFARVRAWGRFDTERHFLVDNRIHRGRPGVHVLTPLETGDGRVILVNRGWLPLAADRRSLPTVPTDGAAREISGRLARLTRAGPRLGDPDRIDPQRWPQLVTWLDHGPAQDALGLDLEPWLLLLDADAADGFEGRDWQPSTMLPATHGAYALQWFSLSAAALVIWLLLGLRRGAPAGTAHESNDGDDR